jgi:hypothetical protein
MRDGREPTKGDGDGDGDGGMLMTPSEVMCRGVPNWRRGACESAIFGLAQAGRTMAFRWGATRSQACDISWPEIHLFPPEEVEFHVGAPDQSGGQGGIVEQEIHRKLELKGWIASPNTHRITK